MSVRCIYLFLLLVVFSSCTPVETVVHRSMPERLVTRISKDIKITPQSVTNVIDGGVEINIEPIDTQRLDSLSLFAVYRNGMQSGEYVSSQSVSNSVSGDWGSKIENKLDELVANKEISSQVAYALRSRVYQGGFEGTEPDLFQAAAIKFPNTFNPFYFNEQYMTVFKITLHNKGNSIQKIKHHNFQVNIGDEQLTPFTLSFIEGNISENKNKVQNLHRFYFPEELVITPEQKVTKYIAVPAIDAINQSIMLQYINNEKAYTYKYESVGRVESGDFNLVPILFSLKLDGLYEKYNETANLFFVLEMENGLTVPIQNDYFYIDREMLDNDMNAYLMLLDKFSKDVRVFSAKPLCKPTDKVCYLDFVY